MTDEVANPDDAAVEKSGSEAVPPKGLCHAQLREESNSTPFSIALPCNQPAQNFGRSNNKHDSLKVKLRLPIAQMLRGIKTDTWPQRNSPESLTAKEKTA